MVNRKELDPERSPRDKFGQVVRTMREERGWTQEELAERIRCTGSHVSAVETGRRPATKQFAKRLDRAFGSGDRLERQSQALRSDALLEGFPEYVECEGRAEEIRLFEAALIPGLLQTREYAEAIEADHVRRGILTPEQAEERISLLIRRQVSLSRTLPPLISVVMDESCIHRQVGGAEVMSAQYTRLLEFAEQSNTALQIAPYSMGERRPFNRLVILLTLANGSPAAYVESQTQGYLDREITFVRPLVRDYHQLQVGALSQAKSVAMIEQLRKGTS
ncbi:helix-turn-helix transcriptional regulator [Streptomyces sp. NPDC000594]|uniref:helix-turn-helix domain-containing protein n=1 Tax=Streptomyces sp. NPDC000594 TaxID=3154261 RepID=UPI0033243816